MLKSLYTIYRNDLCDGEVNMILHRVIVITCKFQTIKVLIIRIVYFNLTCSRGCSKKWEVDIKHWWEAGLMEGGL